MAKQVADFLKEHGADGKAKAIYKAAKDGLNLVAVTFMRNDTKMPVDFVDKIVDALGLPKDNVDTFLSGKANLYLREEDTAKFISAAMNIPIVQDNTFNLFTYGTISVTDGNNAIIRWGW